jgi:hypothetical protein
MATALLPRIECDDAIAHQPAGSCGFRKGDWTFLFDGETRTEYMSIPHGATFDEQYDIARRHCARAIAWKMLREAGWE